MAQTGNPYDCGSRQIRRNQTPCNGDDNEKSRINDYAAVQKGVLPSGLKAANYAGLVAAVLAAEANCTAVVVRDISGTYDGGAPVKGKGVGRVKEQTIGRTNTVVITDLGMSGNEDFWDDLAANPGNYDHFFFGATKAYPAEADPDVSAKNPITDDPDADLEGEITFTFSRKRLLKGYSYDRTPLLKKNAPFLAYTGLTAASGTASIVGETVTVTKATAFSFSVGFTAQPAGAVLDYRLAPGQSQKVPGITMQANGTFASTGIAAAGKTVVTIQATNPCGVLGEVTVTIIAV